MISYKTPDEIYGKLYHDLHVSGLWKDGKIFSDAVPRIPPKDILLSYEKEKSQDNFDLMTFFKSSFKIQKNKKSKYKADKSRSVSDHINILWDLSLIHISEPTRPY